MFDSRSVRRPSGRLYLQPGNETERRGKMSETANKRERDLAVAELSSDLGKMQSLARNMTASIEERRRTAPVAEDAALSCWLSSAGDYLRKVEGSVGELKSAVELAPSRNFALPAVPPPR